MFLSWIIGFEKVGLIIDFGRKIEEEEVISMPDNVSNAIIETVVLNNLDSFQQLFTDDAWSAVL